MREIPLVNGGVALVDNHDYYALVRFKWYWNTKDGKTYIRRYVRYRKPNGNIATTTLLMHRQILGIKDPKIQVDHKNNNGLDNSRINIRAATVTQNHANRTIAPWNKSGFKGVTLRQRDKRWRAQIAIKRKITFIGAFDSAREAACAYDKKAIEVFGDFARTNAMLGLL